MPNKYKGKIVQTETKQLKIIHETKLGVRVECETRPKGIYIDKEKLVTMNDRQEIYYSIAFEKLRTYTVSQLISLGFENAKERKENWFNEAIQNKPFRKRTKWVVHEK